MKKLLLIVSLLTFALNAQSLLLEENFNYGTTANPNITVVAPTWVRHSGTQGPQYTPNGLEYMGYPGSAIGGALSFTFGSSGVNDGDVHRKFSDSISTNQDIYVFAMLRLDSARATADYFLHLAPATIGTTFRMRVFGRSFGTGWVIGLSKSTETRVEDSVNVLNFNQTYLLALKYSFNTTATNDDLVTLYLYDNTFPIVEPGNPLVTLGPTGMGTTADPVNIGSIAVRQGTNTPSGRIDGIRVGTTWGIIPVELTSFIASVSGNSVKLNWTTSTELNNSGFIIERKAKDGQWKKIGFVKGAGTTTLTQHYSFTDKELNSGKYSYRLKQIDFDGTFEYSKSVDVDVNSVFNFAMQQNYPNPFNPTTSISFSIPQSGNVKLTVYNLLGQEIKTLINGNMDAGNYSVDFNANGLFSGIYIYRLEFGGMSLTRKMTLLK
jgi:hypothetical protein